MQGRRRRGSCRDYFAGDTADFGRGYGNGFSGTDRVLYGSIPWGTNEGYLRTRRRKNLGLVCFYTIEVDSNFQKVFSVQLTEGNWRAVVPAKECCSIEPVCCTSDFWKTKSGRWVFHPNKLTRRSERNYTPEELTAIDYVVSGVMEDLPVNASYSLLNRIDALLINDQQGPICRVCTGRGNRMYDVCFAISRSEKETVNQGSIPKKIRFFVSEWKEDRSYCHPERTVRNIIMISAMGNYASDY